jgi:colanic acid/amylovoran biosynthesis glycosyltransferase
MQRIAVVNYRALSPTETFIRDQVNHLPFEVTLIHRESPELCEVPPRLAPLPPVRRSEGLVERYAELLADQKVELVLAQYGTTAAEVLPACKALGLSLVVHFHGHDISRQDLLQRYQKEYSEVFDYAGAIICVSEAMRSKLLALGAQAARLHLIPYGVDTRAFAPGAGPRVPGRLLYCGRFVQKKAPHLILAAFRQIVRRFPESRLHMIGAGPLYEVCQDLVHAFGLHDRVRFLGLFDSEQIRDELRQASVFVNHSVTALDGNSEGTPVTLLEASAAGLPIVASRHAGIPDAVLHEQTGLLVDERDVEGMATSVCRLLEDPELGSELGRRGRARMQEKFEGRKQIGKLGEVIRAVARVSQLSPGGLPDA